MFACCTRPLSEEESQTRREEIRARKHSQAIDLELQQEKKEMKKTVKLLLLGAGESGKSTIQRQMKLIHSSGFTLDERLRRKAGVYAHIISSAKAIINAMQSLKIPWHDPDKCESAALIVSSSPTDIDVDSTTTTSATTSSSSTSTSTSTSTSSTAVDIQLLFNSLKILWQDEGFRKCFERSNEYQLNDNADYFFDALDRLMEPNYVPTADDLLRVRIKTVGIFETKVELGPNTTCFLTDVGGQRSERRKWTQCFGDVSAIIFVIAMNEYDQVLREDSKTNRLREAMTLFKGVWEDKFLAEVAVILFFNKIDLFEAKLSKSDFKVHFPEYKGNQELGSLKTYISKRFTQLAIPKPNKNIYSHYVCALHTPTMKEIFGYVKDIVLQSSVSHMGLL